MGVIEFTLLKMASLASKAKIDRLSAMLAEQAVLVHGNLQTIWMEPLVWSACTCADVHRACRKRVSAALMSRAGNPSWMEPVRTPSVSIGSAGRVGVGAMPTLRA